MISDVTVYPYRKYFPMQTSDPSAIRNCLTVYKECNIAADPADFYLLQSVELAAVVQTFSSLGAVVLFGAKRPGRAVDHSYLAQKLRRI